VVQPGLRAYRFFEQRRRTADTGDRVFRRPGRFQRFRRGSRRREPVGERGLGQKRNAVPRVRRKGQKGRERSNWRRGRR